MPRFQTLRSLIRSPLGQRVKPLARWSYSRLLTSIGMAVLPGGVRFDPARPTALVVRHEASATGAPILALNLAQQLSGSQPVRFARGSEVSLHRMGPEKN